MAWEDHKIETYPRKGVDEEIERKFKANLEQFGLEFAQGYRQAQREMLGGKSRLNNEVQSS